VIVSAYVSCGTAGVGRFGVLGIAGAVFDPNGTNGTDFWNKTVVYAQPPDMGAVQNGKFVVTLAPATNGDVVPAFAAGVFPVVLKYANSSDWSSTRADAIPGDTSALAVTGQGPATILWHDTIPDGGGTTAGIVRLEGMRREPVVAYVSGTNAACGGYYDGYILDPTGSMLTYVGISNAAELRFHSPSSSGVWLLDTSIAAEGNPHVGVMSGLDPYNTNRALVTIDTDSIGNTDAGDNFGGGDMVSEWARGDGFGATLTVVTKNYVGGTGLASLRWDAFGHLYYVAIVG